MVNEHDVTALVTRIKLSFEESGNASETIIRRLVRSLREQLCPHTIAVLGSPLAWDYQYAQLLCACIFRSQPNASWPRITKQLILRDFTEVPPYDGSLGLVIAATAQYINIIELASTDQADALRSALTQSQPRDVSKHIMPSSFVHVVSMVPSGWGLAHHASYHSALSVLDVCTSMGTDIYAADDNGLTPLHVACMSGNYDAIMFLLGKAVSPTTRDRKGVTPIGYFIRFIARTPRQWPQKLSYTECIEVFRALTKGQNYSFWDRVDGRNVPLDRSDLFMGACLCGDDRLSKSLFSISTETMSASDWNVDLIRFICLYAARRGDHRLLAAAASAYYRALTVIPLGLNLPVPRGPTDIADARSRNNDSDNRTTLASVSQPEASFLPLDRLTYAYLLCCCAAIRGSEDCVRITAEILIDLLTLERTAVHKYEDNSGTNTRQEEATEARRMSCQDHRRHLDRMFACVLSTAVITGKTAVLDTLLDILSRLDACFPEDGVRYAILCPTSELHRIFDPFHLEITGISSATLSRTRVDLFNEDKEMEKGKERESIWLKMSPLSLACALGDIASVATLLRTLEKVTSGCQYRLTSLHCPLVGMQWGGPALGDFGISPLLCAAATFHAGVLEILRAHMGDDEFDRACFSSICTDASVRETMISPVDVCLATLNYRLWSSSFSLPEAADALSRLHIPSTDAVETLRVFLTAHNRMRRRVGEGGDAKLLAAASAPVSYPNLYALALPTLDETDDASVAVRHWKQREGELDARLSRVNSRLFGLISGPGRNGPNNIAVATIEAAAKDIRRSRELWDAIAANKSKLSNKLRVVAGGCRSLDNNFDRVAKCVMRVLELVEGPPLPPLGGSVIACGGTKKDLWWKALCRRLQATPANYSGRTSPSLETASPVSNDPVESFVESLYSFADPFTLDGREEAVADLHRPGYAMLSVLMVEELTEEMSTIGKEVDALGYTRVSLRDGTGGGDGKEGKGEKGEEAGKDTPSTWVQTAALQCVQMLTAWLKGLLLDAEILYGSRDSRQGRNASLYPAYGNMLLAAELLQRKAQLEAVLEIVKTRCDKAHYSCDSWLHKLLAKPAAIDSAALASARVLVGGLQALVKRAAKAGVRDNDSSCVRRLGARCFWQHIHSESIDIPFSANFNADHCTAKALESVVGTDSVAVTDDSNPASCADAAASFLISVGAGATKAAVDLSRLDRHGWTPLLSLCVLGLWKSAIALLSQARQSTASGEGSASSSDLVDLSDRLIVDPLSFSVCITALPTLSDSFIGLSGTAATDRVLRGYMNQSLVSWTSVDVDAFCLVHPLLLAANVNAADFVAVYLSNYPDTSLDLRWLEYVQPTATSNQEAMMQLLSRARFTDSVLEDVTSRLNRAYEDLCRRRHRVSILSKFMFRCHLTKVIFSREAKDLMLGAETAPISKVLEKPEKPVNTLVPTIPEALRGLTVEVTGNIRRSTRVVLGNGSLANIDPLNPNVDLVGRGLPRPALSVHIPSRQRAALLHAAELIQRGHAPDTLLESYISFFSLDTHGKSLLLDLVQRGSYRTVNVILQSACSSPIEDGTRHEVTYRNLSLRASIQSHNLADMCSIIENEAATELSLVSQDISEMMADMYCSAPSSASMGLVRELLARADQTWRYILSQDFTAFLQAVNSPFGNILQSLESARQVLSAMMIPLSQIGTVGPSSQRADKVILKNDPNNTRYRAFSQKSDYISKLGTAGILNLLPAAASETVKGILLDWFRLRIARASFATSSTSNAKTVRRARETELSVQQMLFHRLDLTVLDVGEVGDLVISRNMSFPTCDIYQERLDVSRGYEYVNGCNEHVPDIGRSFGRKYVRRRLLHRAKAASFRLDRNILSANLSSVIDALPDQIKAETSKAYAKFMKSYNLYIKSKTPSLKPSLGDRSSRDETTSIDSEVDSQLPMHIDSMKDFMLLFKSLQEQPEDVYKPLRLSYIILDFARTLLNARALILSTRKSLDHFSKTSWNHSAVLRSTDIRAESSTQSHPFDELMQRESRAKLRLRDVSQFSFIRRADMAHQRWGVLSSLKLMDLVQPEQFSAMLSFHRSAGAGRFCVFRDIVVEGLATLLLALGRPDLCEFVCRLSREVGKVPSPTASCCVPFHASDEKPATELLKFLRGIRVCDSLDASKFTGFGATEKSSMISAGEKKSSRLETSVQLYTKQTYFAELVRHQRLLRDFSVAFKAGSDLKDFADPEYRNAILMRSSRKEGEIDSAAMEEEDSSRGYVSSAVTVTPDLGASADELQAVMQAAYRRGEATSGDAKENGGGWHRNDLDLDAQQRRDDLQGAYHAANSIAFLLQTTARLWQRGAEIYKHDVQFLLARGEMFNPLHALCVPSSLFDWARRINSSTGISSSPSRGRIVSRLELHESESSRADKIKIGRLLVSTFVPIATPPFIQPSSMFTRGSVASISFSDGGDPTGPNAICLSALFAEPGLLRIFLDSEMKRYTTCTVDMQLSPPKILPLSSTTTTKDEPKKSFKDLLCFRFLIWNVLMAYPVSEDVSLAHFRCTNGFCTGYLSTSASLSYCNGVNVSTKHYSELCGRYDACLALLLDLAFPVTNPENVPYTVVDLACMKGVRSILPRLISVAAESPSTVLSREKSAEVQDSSASNKKTSVLDRQFQHLSAPHFLVLSGEGEYERTSEATRSGSSLVAAVIEDMLVRRSASATPSEKSRAILLESVMKVRKLLPPRERLDFASSLHAEYVVYHSAYSGLYEMHEGEEEKREIRVDGSVDGRPRIATLIADPDPPTTVLKGDMKTLIATTCRQDIILAVLSLVARLRRPVLPHCPLWSALCGWLKNNCFADDAGEEEDEDSPGLIPRDWTLLHLMIVSGNMLSFKPLFLQVLAAYVRPTPPVLTKLLQPNDRDSDHGNIAVATINNNVYTSAGRAFLRSLLQYACYYGSVEAIKITLSTSEKGWVDWLRDIEYCSVSVESIGAGARATERLLVSVPAVPFAPLQITTDLVNIVFSGCKSADVLNFLRTPRLETANVVGAATDVMVAGSVSWLDIVKAITEGSHNEDFCACLLTSFFATEFTLTRVDRSSSDTSLEQKRLLNAPVTTVMTATKMVGDDAVRAQRGCTYEIKGASLGETLMHVSCRRGWAGFTRALLELGASPWVLDAQGYSAIRVSVVVGARNGSPSVSRAIADHFRRTETSALMTKLLTAIRTLEFVIRSHLLRRHRLRSVSPAAEADSKLLSMHNT